MSCLLWYWDARGVEFSRCWPNVERREEKGYASSSIGWDRTTASDERGASACCGREGRSRAHQGRRHLPFGRALPGRDLTGRPLASDAGTRDRRGRGRGGVTGDQRKSWRQGVPPLSANLRRLLLLQRRQRAILRPGCDAGQTLRRWLCRIHCRARPQRRLPARRNPLRARRGSHVLLVHFVPRPAQGKVKARRNGGRLWGGGAWHVGHSARQGFWGMR